MESNSTTRSQKIIQVLEKLIQLLKIAGNTPIGHAWCLYFEKMLIKLHRPHELYKIAEELMNIYTGGMGSFSDLVLQKNFKVLDEDDELELLRNELYVLIDEIIVEHRGGYINHHPDGDYFISLEMAEKIKNGEEIPEDIRRKLDGEFK